MARTAQPLEDYLRDAREDADCALKLLASTDLKDAALLEAMLPDLEKALRNAANGLRRRSQTAATEAAQQRGPTGDSQHSTPPLLTRP